MSKKILSVLLAVVMVLAMGTVAMVSASAQIDSLPAVADGCYRYYFYMPEQWRNDYAYTAGIYWWEGTDACPSWPGYEATSTGYKTDDGEVFYYDVPTDVTTIIWNNYLDGGTDKTLPIYTAAYQTINIGSEYYDVDENAFIPGGTNDFNGMIFVTDFNQIDKNEFSGKMTFGGNWCYYYGNGEYGDTPVKGDGQTLADYAFNPGELPTEDTTPEPSETEPAPSETEPTPTETEPQPTETEPVPVVSQNITIGGNCGEEATFTCAELNDGETLTYTVTVQAAELFEDIQATVYYDNTVLELVRSESVDDEPYEACPNLGDVIFNADLEGQVKFNSVKIRGFDFSEPQTLVTLQFKVIGEGDASINIDIEEMTIKGDGTESYFTGNEQVKTEGITVDLALDGVVEPVIPTEPSTAPTEPSTAPTESTPAPSETKPVPSESKPAPDTDPTSVTGATDKPADVPTTGGNATYLYVALAVLALAACAVVILRKKVNG